MKIFRLFLWMGFFLVTSTTLQAAQVFYLGSESQKGSSQKNPSYSLKQRLSDFLDFGAVDKPLDERSGQLSGSIMQEVDWNNVTGNKSKSFLENGFDSNTEVNLSAVEKLGSDYRFEGQLMMRKTDNKRIEPRRDVRIKQYDMKVLNDQQLYEFGQFYGDYSNFVLSDSLEGVNVEFTPGMDQTYGFVAAKSQGPDVAGDIFQRNVTGVQAQRGFFGESDIFSKFILGVQSATSQDDSSTIGAVSAQDLDNSVFGVDGEIAFYKWLSFDFEVARSRNIADRDVVGDAAHDYGNALRLQPKLDLGAIGVRYLYYYVQPWFSTDTGSAANDKIQHQANVDWRLNDLMTLNLTENYYWDHLDGSTKTKRTTNDEKQIALSWRPFLEKPDFMFRPYLGYSERFSDDVGTSVESRTRTLGFSVNSSLDEKTTAGFNYEYRAFADDANKANSDYFNRVGFNLGKETQFLTRRFYYSIGPAFDIRRTKADSNLDINTTLALNGQYDATDFAVMRFGFNGQNTNSARVNSDYLNTQDFFEYDHRLSQKRDTHGILRWENNRYDHEDGTQEYEEYRVVLKFLSRF